ncbi:MAG: RraA family protein [Alphaproteobacteria bacterium]
MTQEPLRQDDLEALRAFDTPTICNALEVVAPERRATGFTSEPLVCADPALPPVVGYARTATIRAVAPPPASAEEQRARRAAYYEYVGEGPGPTVMVIADIDARPGFGAWWGEVNTTVHKALGCLGCVTNGSIRDLDALAPGFQLLAGAVGPSHAWVHVVDFGGAVSVHGMGVRHGDLIHADRHGAVVVPAEVARDLPAAVDLVARREKVILDACARPDFDIETLKRAMAESAEIR